MLTILYLSQVRNDWGNVHSVILIATFRIMQKTQVEPPKNYRPVISEEGLKIKFDPKSPKFKSN